MLKINLHPFPELKSESVYLRQITNEDAPMVLALHGNPELMRYIPLPVQSGIQDALEYMRKIDAKTLINEWINWAIALKGDSKMIGIAGLYKIETQHHRCQLGYMVLPAHAGKGISTEATRLMLEFAFGQLHMHSVEAVIDPRNVASERVLQKNGFVKEGHLTENTFYKDEFTDTVIYSLLKRNWEKSK